MSNSPERPPWDWGPPEPPQPGWQDEQKQSQGDPRRRPRPFGAVVAVLGALILVAIGLCALLVVRQPSGTVGVTPSGQPADESGLVAQAKAAIDTLPVKGRAPKTGYDREAQFGDPWIDIDANGCDTRNDILQRDLTQIELRDACIVETGVLDDPYSGRSIDFQRGRDTSAEVQIDHVVALSNAWQTGAQQLGYAERVAFANDPLELLAVDGPLNQQKGAGDAATWLPPNKSFRCEYVSLQVLVKDRWGLWLTPPEKDAIQRELAKC